MKKLLFLTSRLPFPPIGGDKLRTFHFIEYLSRHFRVTIISFVESKDELSCIDEYRQMYDKLIAVDLSKRRSYGNCFMGLFSSLPLQVHYYDSKKMRKVVEDELKQGYNVIFCHLIRMSQYLPCHTKITKVVDFTDAISLNYSRSKKFRKGLFSIIDSMEASRVLKYETKSIAASDWSIFISDVDASYLRGFNSVEAGKIRVVPNGVDLNKYAFHDRGYNKNQIVFLGNMRTFPNTDAVLYFVNEVLPLIKKGEPDTTFYIVGSEPGMKVLELHDGKNVIVTGYVESVIPYLKESALLVAPMRAGAGVQNKILEALAVGTPVVTTSIGAEGFDEPSIRVANTVAELCETTLDVMRNEEVRRALAVNGRQYVEERASWDKAFKHLDRLLGVESTVKELA